MTGYDVFTVKATSEQDAIESAMNGYFEYVESGDDSGYDWNYADAIKVD